MKQRSMILTVVGVLVVILVFLAAGFLGNTVEPVRKVPRVALIMKTIERVNQFWVSLEEGAIQAAEDHGIELGVYGPYREDKIDSQIRIMREVIKSGPDVIILTAADYRRLVPIVKEANGSGIKVITADSFIESADAVCEIGTASYDVGRKLGLFLQEKMVPGGRVLIVSYVKESSTAIDREKGLRDQLSGVFEIADTVFNYDNIEIAYQETLKRLTEDSGIKGVAALNETSARGALRAVRDSGRSDGITLVTVDSDYEIINALESGLIDATVVQKPYNVGYISVRTANDIINGRSVPRRLDTGSVLITVENMYEPVNQKLLFPLR